jgi:hypothetical protein
MLSVQSSTLSNLPIGCLAEVMLRNEGVESTRNCSLVCRELFLKMQENAIWYLLCVRDGFPVRAIDESFKKRYQYECNLAKERFTWRAIEATPFCPIDSALQYCMADNKLAITRSYNPNSRYLMIDGKFNITRQNRSITVRDLKTNKQFETSNHDYVNQKIITIQGNYLVCEESDLTNNKLFFIHDLTQKEIIRSFERLYHFAFYGSRLIKPNSDSSGVEIHDMLSEVEIPQDGQQKFNFETLSLPRGLHVSCIAASKEKLFVGTAEGHICICNYEAKTFTDHPITKSLLPKNEKIERLMISDDLLIVFQQTTSKLYRITFWDINTAKLQYSLPECGEKCILSEKKFFFTQSNNSRSLSFFDLDRGKVRYLPNPWNWNSEDCIISSRGDHQCYATDKNFFVRYERHIKIYDFLANYDEILTDIMQSWIDPAVDMFFLDRLARLPKTITTQICGELYEILYPQTDDLESKRNAFHDIRHLGSTREQRILAIESYLAKGQFYSLSQEEKDQVYGELYKVIGHFEKDYWGCSEDAFHHRNGQRSTPQQRLLAIQNHFAKRAQSSSQIK